jgi:histidyl-tRNA synthetase
MPARGLPGFRDFYPDDITLRNHIFAAWRSVASRYGFEEYDGPPLEPLELYTDKSGPDIVAQLYEFTDRGERRVALRPEMTPTLARMVAARAGALKKPIRWFSIPQLFRYERQQRGRLREHFQLNMDLIGEAGPLADAEIIAAAVDIQRCLGLGPADIHVRVSDRRVLSHLLRDAGVPEAELGATFTAIDRSERLPQKAAEILQETLGNVLHADEVAKRVLGIARIRDWAALEDALQATSGGAKPAEDLFECRDALDAMGLGEFVVLDLSVVRGLAYYTGIVFELFDAKRSLRAICGGGRYDGLLGAIGGADLPAVGFGMGDVVLGELVKERGLAPSAGGVMDVFLVAVTSEDRPVVLRLAHDLRDRGARVEFALKEQSIGKQLGLAAARQARLAIVVGPQERAAGIVVRRDLATGQEERVPVGTLLAEWDRGKETAGAPQASAKSRRAPAPAPASTRSRR